MRLVVRKLQSLANTRLVVRNAAKTLVNTRLEPTPLTIGEAANTKIAQTWGLIHLNQQFSPIP